MGQLVKCKVRDITAKRDAESRWEIRLERGVLPASVREVAGKPIKLIFAYRQYAAYTGIAAAGTTNQYFWINTHKDEAGCIMDILRSHGYKPNDEIILRPEQLGWTVVKVVK